MIGLSGRVDAISNSNRQVTMSQSDDRSHLAKRRKLDTSQEPESSPVITSHTQIRSLLVFQQNVVESKQGEHSPSNAG